MPGAAGSQAPGGLVALATRRLKAYRKIGMVRAIESLARNGAASLVIGPSDDRPSTMIQTGQTVGNGPLHCRPQHLPAGCVWTADGIQGWTTCPGAWPVGGRADTPGKDVVLSASAVSSSGVTDGGS